MALRKNLLLICLAGLMLLAVGGFSPPGVGQDRDDEERLQRLLERFPDADANGDVRLTREEARAFQVQRRREREQRRERPRDPEPTQADLEYGSHPRQRIDLWVAPSDKPTPLLVYVHGGGFRGGDKGSVRGRGLVPTCLSEGISVASINYRLTDTGPAPLQMHDAARAIQYLRSRADEFGLDKHRVAATGGSAGGCISLWLAFHPDRAQPDSADPVARESTRILAAGPNGAQPTLDWHTFRDWFDCPDLQVHPALEPLFDVESAEELDRPEMRALMREVSPLTYLTPDDPPVYLVYGSRDVPVDGTTTPGVWVHHPRLGIRLQEAMREAGVDCFLEYPGGEPVEAYRNQLEFLIERLRAGDGASG